MLSTDIASPLSKFEGLRLWLLVTAWLSAVLMKFFGFSVHGFTIFGVICFLLFAVMTLPRLRWDSLAILAGMIALAFLLLPRMPSVEALLGAIEYVLIFAALLPTMALVKATAMTMPSVHQSQTNLASLPSAASASGIQITGHVFGGIINTGTFAILSAVLPPDAPESDRRAAAEAAIRGMATSAAWSPFFVGFAVGQSFVEPHYAWMAIGFGVFVALLFMACSLPLINRDFSHRQVGMAIACLRPVASRLAFVFGCVIATALIFKLTALAAVVCTMPWLVALQMARKPATIPHIFQQTKIALANIADDLIVISAAMIVAFLVNRYNNIGEMMQLFYPDMLPGWVALIGTPVIVTLASVFGIHPVISTTGLLTIFSGGGADVHPALLVEAHLIAWGAGAMASIASLSVISTSGLFKVSTHKLAFGKNILIAFTYALSGGIVLTLLNNFMW